MSELRGSNGDFTPTQNALLIETGEFTSQGWLKMKRHNQIFITLLNNFLPVNNLLAHL